MTSRTYKGAGVDIEAGAAFVETIAPLARATGRTGVMGGLGGFGGLFDLAAAGYSDPVLVAATDGVGTKLAVAAAAGRHRTVGIDLVAMCVNDIVVQGAEPLFFLDYFATGRLLPETAEAVVAGIAAGCRAAGCALLGGETAEMPGFYGPGAYDLAGFAVGAVERRALLTGAAVTAGDLVLGLASDGLHANGFSLVRRLVEDAGLDYGGPAPFAPSEALGEALLAPTRIYVAACRTALAAGGVKALAHITGGGLVDNLPRVLPAGLGAEIEVGSWPVPAVFRWLAAAGGIAAAEMARTFNCGIGMAAVTAPDDAVRVEAALARAGETVYRIGRIVDCDGGDRLVLAGLPEDWPR